MASKKTKNSVDATTVIKYVALIGNGLYILWVILKGVSQGFQWTPAQIMTYVFLLFLMGINIFLLVSKE